MYEESNQRNRILFVDDEKGIRNLMKVIISSAGYEPVIAKSGEDGIEKFQEYWDGLRLVITDLHMPGISGLELTKQIRQNYPDSRIPILGLTGWGTEEIKRDCINVGMADLLLKPLTRKHLEDAVQEHAIAQLSSFHSF